MFFYIVLALGIQALQIESVLCQSVIGPYHQGNPGSISQIAGLFGPNPNQIGPIPGQLNQIAGQLGPNLGQIGSINGQINQIAGQYGPNNGQMVGQIGPNLGQLNQLTGQGIQSGSYGPIIGNLGPGNFGPAGPNGYSYPGSISSYGGSGAGEVSVLGELPVAGSTNVLGHVPVIGTVQFGGPVAAAGAVTISGTCACNLPPFGY